MPGHAPQRLDAVWRAQAEAQVALLLDLLDALDGDETDMCAEDHVITGTYHGSGRWLDDGRAIGSEEDEEESGDERETSLGWSVDGEKGLGNQDLEADDSDAEETDGCEAETDCRLADETTYYSRGDILRQQLARAGSLPGDAVPVVLVGAVA